MLARARTFVEEIGELFAMGGGGPPPIVADPRVVARVRRAVPLPHQGHRRARHARGRPLGATVALQVGQLTRQLGAGSLTGAAVMLGIVREASPIAAALLIAGAGGSAIAADMGARHIRDELAAMEVMAVNPVHRLVTPRLWASATVSVALVSFVIVAGVAGGFFFNVVLQGVSPGAYFGNATQLLQIADLLSALIKAFIFGIIAGVVACYRGMTCTRSPAGVGIAVKRAVVLTIILVFGVNYVISSLYFVLVPQRI